MLMLVGSDLDGLFPQKIFELKKLTYLELPDNANLVVQVQSFSNGSSLQMLALGGTNLSIANPSSVGNLRSLQFLGIDAALISKEFSSSLSTLDSLEMLDLSQFVLQRMSHSSHGLVTSTTCSS
jgi:Leucine-rich repeat (LRR) protein